MVASVDGDMGDNGDYDQDKHCDRFNDELCLHAAGFQKEQCAERDLLDV